MLDAAAVEVTERGHSSTIMDVTTESKPKCSNGCGRPVKARSLCSGCYEKDRAKHMPLCAIKGCTNRARAKGLCSLHLQRKAKGASMFAPPQVKGRTIPMSERYNERGERVCSKCLRWLPRTDFHKREKQTPGDDGLRSTCNRCVICWRYGITYHQFAELLEEQGGCCAICRKDICASGRELSIDHDHSCCPQGGRSCGDCVRGILCQPCNGMLGYAQDDPEILKAGINYLLIPRPQRR